MNFAGAGAHQKLQLVDLHCMYVTGSEEEEEEEWGCWSDRWTGMVVG
jgi:hypothetical protein